MKDIKIKITKSTRYVDFENDNEKVGNIGENLQTMLVFSFTDEFVKGQARLEYTINGESQYVFMEKVGETYQTPVTSQLAQCGSVDLQLVITEGTDKNEIPKFKSNVFYLPFGKSINAEIEQAEGYEEWIDIANTKLNEIDEAVEQANNLDINANKNENVTTINVTKKDGSIQTVEIYDGKNGEKGESNELTIGEVVDGEEANATITGESPNQILNLTLPRGETGKSGVYIGSEKPTDEEIKVWIDTDGEADFQSEVSASGVLFDDEETLQEKFDNGSLGGSGGGSDTYDLGEFTIHMIANQYDEINNLTLSATDLSILKLSLNEVQEKYENGEISKVKTKFTVTELVLENGEGILGEQVTYNLEFVPCKWVDGLRDDEECFALCCETSRYSYSQIQVKHLFQINKHGDAWLLACITEGLDMQIL